MLNKIVLLGILAFLLGSCTVMAGNLNQWPAMAIATAAILALKVWNNRKKVLAWPMEFLLFAAVTMIVFNLAWLYFFDLPV